MNYPIKKGIEFLLQKKFPKVKLDGSSIEEDVFSHYADPMKNKTLNVGLYVNNFSDVSEKERFEIRDMIRNLIMMMGLEYKVEVYWDYGSSGKMY